MLKKALPLDMDMLCAELALTEDGVARLKPRKGARKLIPYKSKTPYRQIRLRGQPHRLSRVVFALANGRPPAHEVDHIDRDRGNDHPSNLRDATPSENCLNRGLRSDNATGHPGVRYIGYRAEVYEGGVLAWAADFPTLEEAVAARAAVLRDGIPQKKNRPRKGACDDLVIG